MMQTSLFIFHLATDQFAKVRSFTEIVIYQEQMSSKFQDTDDFFFFPSELSNIIFHQC